MTFKISTFVLLLACLLFLIAYSSDLKVFSVEPFGELKLKMKRVEEIREKPKEESEVPAGSIFIKGKYFVDTYTIETKSNKEIWSKTISFAAILEKNFNSMIDVFAIKIIDKSLLVVYLNKKDIYIDELQSNNLDIWELKKTVNFKIGESNLIISKCSIVPKEQNQLEIIFNLANEKKYTYNYKDGEISKIE